MAVRLFWVEKEGYWGYFFSAEGRVAEGSMMMSPPSTIVSEGS